MNCESQFRNNFSVFVVFWFVFTVVPCFRDSARLTTTNKNKLLSSPESNPHGVSEFLNSPLRKMLEKLTISMWIIFEEDSRVFNGF